MKSSATRNNVGNEDYPVIQKVNNGTVEDPVKWSMDSEGMMGI